MNYFISAYFKFLQYYFLSKTNRFDDKFCYKAMGSEEEIAEKISLVIKKIHDSPIFYELKRNAQVCICFLSFN